MKKSNSPSRTVPLIPGFPRISLLSPGDFFWISLSFPFGVPRISWDLLGFPRISWDFFGFLWISLISQDFLGCP